MEQKSLFDFYEESVLPKRRKVRPRKVARKRETIMAKNAAIGLPIEVAKPTEAAKKKPMGKKISASGKVAKKQRKKRTLRPYPVVSFREAAVLGDAIFRFASGEKVRKLTILEKMERPPDSSVTKMLITNSGKYKLTTGGYSAEWLELTDLGNKACNPESPQRTRLDAQFQLAVFGIAPFKLLYDTYVGKKLPAHEVMKDKLDDGKVGVDNLKECIDLFVVNVKELGLLRTIAGAETLVPIEQALEEAASDKGSDIRPTSSGPLPTDHPGKKLSATKWDATCFYVSPIGDPNSDARKHSDLFLSTLVEPALRELGLNVVRADQIAEPGMITTHVIEHLRLCKLVIVDLSLLNPNVFYEMALRHAVKLPIVQIIRKADRLPFDVNQVNSIIIDNTDIYTFTPKIETYKSEITTFARRALEDPEHNGNPISVFFPDFWK